MRTNYNSVTHQYYKTRLTENIQSRKSVKTSLVKKEQPPQVSISFERKNDIYQTQKR